MQENVSLKNKNTFKIGGKAKYYTEVSSKEELKKVLALNLPFFVLGEGSNVLVSDNGFNGIVIKLNFKDILIKDNTIQVGAGLLLRDLVLKAKELNLGGIEWAIGIPGTIGGALFGNAGVPNFTIGNMVKQVKVLQGNKVKTFKQQDCLFNYRDSVFKKNKDLIILSALLVFPYILEQYH
jgi:UDP-N-acetylmuramate dehydrogenase